MDWEQLRRDGFQGWGGARFAELGCGNGAVTSLFGGYRVTGVDVSAAALAWARERLGPGVELIVDGNCLHCLLGPARPKALAAVSRLLARGGVFAVSSLCGCGSAPVDRHLAKSLVGSPLAVGMSDVRQWQA